MARRARRTWDQRLKPIVDLRSSTQPAERALSLQVTLPLGDLLWLAKQAGDLPLPIHIDPTLEETSAAASALETRLSGGSAGPGAQAQALLASELARMADPSAADLARLRELGLLDDAGTPTPMALSTLRALSAAEVLFVLDLVVGSGPQARSVRSWIAVVGERIAQLSIGGLEVELASYDVRELSAVLARSVRITPVPAEESDDRDRLVAQAVLPFELFTAGVEAIHRGRDDLATELIRVQRAPTLIDGVPAATAEILMLLGALDAGVIGRMRLVITRPHVDEGEPLVLGVVSWLWTEDGWRALLPKTVDHRQVVEIRAVTDRDLGALAAPVLAEVMGTTPDKSSLRSGLPRDPGSGHP